MRKIEIQELELIRGKNKVMIISILIFLLSIIPSVMIMLKLRNRRMDDELYIKSCNSAIKSGFFSVIPIIGVSAVFEIVTRLLALTLLKNAGVLVNEAIHTFIVLALAEEIVKFQCLRILLKKRYNEYTWADVVAFMVIIGTGFGLVEDIPYAIGSSPVEMLIRGFTMGHVGYGFIMGWFYGKSLYTRKRRFGVIAFMVPFLIHGLYDFSLTPELLEVNDNLAAIALSLALTDIILLILMIRFFIRAKKIERYNIPIE